MGQKKKKGLNFLPVMISGRRTARSSCLCGPCYFAAFNFIGYFIATSILNCLEMAAQTISQARTVLRTVHVKHAVRAVLTCPIHVARPSKVAVFKPSSSLSVRSRKATTLAMASASSGLPIDLRGEEMRSEMWNTNAHCPIMCPQRLIICKNFHFQAKKRSLPASLMTRYDY